jgi:integrase
VDALRASERDGYLWDDELTGFGVKVTPAGRKVYLVQYRIGGRSGRTRRVTIGKHGILTPDQARTEAKRLLAMVAGGVDPAVVKDHFRTEPTLGMMLKEFTETHILPNLRRSTRNEWLRTIRLSIPETLKRHRVSDLGRTQIAKLHHDLRHTPSQANRVVAILSKFFNWAEARGLRPDGSNPCRHVQKYREKKRERFLSGEELTRLGEALRNADSDKMASPWAIAAIRLLTLTGARLSEVLTLKWEFVDFDRAIIRLPESKTGAKTLYMNAPALTVLNELPRMDGNAFVIVGEKAGAHLVNLQKPWRRIRNAAGLSDVRLHDLRHSFASVAASRGMSLPVIGALLGHSQPATTARYAHLAADPLKAASEAIAGRIAGSLEGTHEAPAVQSVHRSKMTDC